MRANPLGFSVKLITGVSGVRRRRGGVRRVRRLGVGQPAPPARVRLRPPRARAAVAVPLAQLPGAAARTRAARATRARHAGLRAPRRDAVQAAAAGRSWHGWLLPAWPQPRPQPVTGAERGLPTGALRALPPGPPTALRARPPPPPPR